MEPRSRPRTHGGATAAALRRFTVADEMILLVPLTASLVVARSFWQYDLARFLRSRPERFSLLELLDWVPVLCFGLLPRLLALVMPALLLIRLRRPRPACGDCRGSPESWPAPRQPRPSRPAG